MLEELIELMPDATWTAAAIGRLQLDANHWALKRGGHVRTGLEDNIYFEKGRLAASNAELVKRVADLCGKYDRHPASTAEEIGDIVVTAQKRAQNIQDVPISISAFDENAIKEAGFTNSLSIADQVPSLEIKTFGGVPNIFIRGVGNNDFNSSSIGPISIYRDDVVVASTGSQIFSLFDLERVEVVDRKSVV